MSAFKKHPHSFPEQKPNQPRVETKCTCCGLRRIPKGNYAYVYCRGDEVVSVQVPCENKAAPELQPITMERLEKLNTNGKLLHECMVHLIAANNELRQAGNQSNARKMSDRFLEWIHKN